MSIAVTRIHKTFGAFTALDDVSLSVPSGKLVALLGPSGSGKTTLLRVIAGLDYADPGSGRIEFHGEDVTDVPAGQRRVGFVFQHYALFRHMTVFENIAFGLQVRPRRDRPSPDVICERVHELLKLVQLDGLDARYPSQLSGDNGSGWPWRAPWPWSRACCCWMNRLAPWMRRYARNYAAGCGSSTSKCISRRCS
jgi:sulfate transport system ATP-binding protein